MIKRVVLLGPSHHVAFTGLALSSADVFNTAQDTQQALLLIHVDYQDKMNLRLQADVCFA
jgi:predicted class III extradiol MEMO1 family dioxygenase